MSSNASRHAKSPLGQNIRQARKARGLSQQDLAVEMDVHVMQVSRWERGKNRPGAAKETKLLDLLFDGDYAAMYAGPEREAA